MRRGGADVALHNDYFAAAIGEKPNWDSPVYLIGLGQLRRERWNDIKIKFSQMSRKFQVPLWNIDRTNNETVIYEFQNLGIKVEGVIFTASEKINMMQRVSKSLALGQLKIPDTGGKKFNEQTSSKDKELFREFWRQAQEQEYEHISANPRLIHPEGRHDDLLWGVALMLRAFEQKKMVRGIVKSLNPL